MSSLFPPMHWDTQCVPTKEVVCKNEKKVCSQNVLFTCLIKLSKVFKTMEKFRNRKHWQYVFAMGPILPHWFHKVFERILWWDYCSSSLYWMCYTSTKHLLEGWKNHYSYQGLDMVLFCTAIGEIPSHGFGEGDLLSMNNLVRSAGLH